MKYVMGLGECGIAELFGSTAVCALYVPLSKLPGIREKYKDSIGKYVDDYQAFEIVKDLFPNYVARKYNLVDWFASSHYYEVSQDDGPNVTGPMNYMTDDPNFAMDSLDWLLSCVYVPKVSYFNELVKSSEYSVAMAGYMLISETEDYLLMEVNDIYDNLAVKHGRPERGDVVIDSLNPTDQYIVNFLASTIARIAYLSQIQQLELQCHASLPRGISKEANDFYLTRCVKMSPEEKNMLFKISYMEDMRNAR